MPVEGEQVDPRLERVSGNPDVVRRNGRSLVAERGGDTARTIGSDKRYWQEFYVGIFRKGLEIRRIFS
jgi:hypothetical protein